MDEVLEQLNVLRAEVKTWASRAEDLLAGRATKAEHSPVRATECDFGRWYYNEGRKLESFAAYKRLELPHDNQHILYKRIFDLVFDDGETSTLGKILAGGKSLKEEHHAEATKLLPHLHSVSKQLLELIDMLEEQIKMASTKQLKNRAAEAPAKSGSKYSEVSKMLDSLDSEINEDLK